MKREEVIHNLVPRFQNAIAGVQAEVPKEQHDEVIVAFKEAIFFDSRLGPDAVDYALEAIERCVRQGGGC